MVHTQTGAETLLFIHVFYDTQRRIKLFLMHHANGIRLLSEYQRKINIKPLLTNNNCLAFVLIAKCGIQLHCTRTVHEIVPRCPLYFVTIVRAYVSCLIAVNCMTYVLAMCVVTQFRARVVWAPIRPSLLNTL
jgi:hypothetical protein